MLGKARDTPFEIITDANFEGGSETFSSPNTTQCQSLQCTSRIYHRSGFNLQSILSSVRQFIKDR